MSRLLWRNATTFFTHKDHSDAPFRRFEPASSIIPRLTTSLRHDPFAALREQNYRLFVIGWLPASLGLQMQATALAWEMYERTGDPLALGILGLARALPTVALALPAGRIVDLVDRRRVLVFTQMGFTIASLLLAVGSWMWANGSFSTMRTGVWMMYFLVALTGCARVFNGPSRSSLLPQIFRSGVSGAAFHNAVTWNSGVFQLAAMIGPVVAGAMIAATNHAWPVYIITAVTCLWFGIMVMFIRPFDIETTAKKNPKYKSIWQLVRPSALLPGILEGVRHIRRERTIFGAITLDLFAVLLGGATALMPIYAKDILHVGPRGLGALKAAPFVGAFIMAIVMAYRPAFKKAGPTMLWSVAGFGLCTIVFGVSHWFWLSITMLALLGALDNISVVVRSVLVNVRTPNELRGRVAAVNSVFIESSNEIGGFESGLVAKYLGAMFSVVAGGIGTVAVVIAMACWIPELRRLRRISPTDQDDELIERETEAKAEAML